MSMVSPRDRVAIARADSAGSKRIWVVRQAALKPIISSLFDTFRVTVNKSTGDGERTQNGRPATNAHERSHRRGFNLGEPTDEFGMTPVGGRRKRIVDVVVATAFAILASPLLLVIAAAVKFSMGGPVIYRHRRIGFGGKYFDCLKFRTMVSNGDEVLEHHFAVNPEAAEEWRRSYKLAADPRVTRLGWFLRKTSLDELPQLLNILRGDMSCVGPRPIVADELERYGVHAHEYLRARPGVTGSWQVSGRSNVSYGDRVKLDAEYVRRWSFATDLVILARTLPAVIKVDQAA